MESPQRFSVTQRDTNKHTGTGIEAESTTQYDLELEARGSLRNKAWADGFLASNGAQIPLFVRPAQQLK